VTGAVDFSPQRLLGALESVRRDIAIPPSGYCVALSGGLDSSVLLAALARLGNAAGVAPLRALHVDHGLHGEARQWSERSRAFAAACGIPCEIVQVDARAASGESPEAAARAARYGVFAARLEARELLLTAHHADDQLETVLLQCLRGGGLRAVAGMRAVTPFSRGWHARPLLGFTRAQLHLWAQRSALEWCEDPSNLDLRFDRNFLRHEVVPALYRRWPAAAVTIGRVARQAADALELEQAAAAADLAVLVEGATLSLDRLRPMTAPRQRRALRAWLGARSLPMPSASTLEALRGDMLAAAADRIPETRWSGAIVRRYRGRLYASATRIEPAADRGDTLLPGQDVDLGPLGRLELRAVRGRGLSQSRLTGTLRIVARPVGATFQPAGSAHRRPLRKWLQERGVLPWLRASLPCVCVGTEIVAVGDLAYAARLAATPDEDGWLIEWHGRPPLTEAESIASRTVADDASP
jgi:tRNA(Ile)-lysidine synthase